MDYCNSLLYGVKSNDLHRLQSLQHKAAKLIFCAPRRSDPIPLMNSHHWLPLNKRIKFKLCLLIYKCLNDCAPPYLIDTICRKTTSSKGPVTRSAKDKTHLIKPRCNKIIGDKSFAVAGPSIWNSLPRSIGETTSITVFKKKLETHLYNLHRLFHISCVSLLLSFW